LVSRARRFLPSAWADGLGQGTGVRQLVGQRRKDGARGDTDSSDTERQEEQMPWGSWINDLPTEFFLVVHITAFALGAGFAWLAFKRELALLGSAFSLFAAAELVYMTYHLDWTVFLFAHTIAEVLDLTAFVLVFVAAVYSAVRRPALNTVEVNR
jgi:hypothetical protein